MKLQRTVDKIEKATRARWWLLALLMLASTRWPMLVAIEIGAIALAFWHFSDQPERAA